MSSTRSVCDVSGTEPLRPGRGETFATLQALAAQGAVVHLFDDVFLPADMVGRRPLRVAALAEIVPAHAVVTGLAAAWVWGGPKPANVRVLLPLNGSRRLRPGVIATQDRRVPPEHLQVFQVDHDRTLQVTTPARTALEIIAAEDLSQPSGNAALTWLLEHLVEPHEVTDLLDVKHGMPGARDLRRRVPTVLAAHQV